MTLLPNPQSESGNEDNNRSSKPLHPAPKLRRRDASKWGFEYIEVTPEQLTYDSDNEEVEIIVSENTNFVPPPPMVCVLVGPPEHRVFFNGDLVRRHTQFFGNMPEKKMYIKGGVRVFRLPEYDEVAFSVFDAWLGCLFGPGKGMSIANRDSTDAHLLFKSYILALQLHAPLFKEFILGEIQVYFCSRARLTLDHIRYVYDNTDQTDDLLRRYCIWKMCVQVSTDEKLANEVFLELSIENGPLMKDYFEACGRFSTGEEDLQPFMLE